MKDIYRHLKALLNTHDEVCIVSSYPSSANPDGIQKLIRYTYVPSLQHQDDDASAILASKIMSSPDTVDMGSLLYLEDIEGLHLLERYVSKPRMIILGGGHIAIPLVKLASICGFSPLVYDDRPKFANAGRFPEADEVIMDDFAMLSSRVKLARNDYVVIVTRGHKNDKQCLTEILDKGADAHTEPAYIGMIGSARRVAIVLDELKSEGVPTARVDSVCTPIGIDIGAVTPEEIAVAIVAECIKVRRQGAKAVLGSNAWPVTSGCDVDMAHWLAEYGDGADALLTIIDTHGSVPRECGAKMAMSYDGQSFGTIGGGCAEAGVMNEARTIIRDGGWKLVSIDMAGTAEDDGMVCGGKMKVLIEKLGEVQV